MCYDQIKALQADYADDTNYNEDGWSQHPSLFPLEKKLSNFNDDGFFLSF